MKPILALAALALIALCQVGCSAGGSVGHDGHRHGVGVSGTDRGPGVSGSATVY